MPTDTRPCLANSPMANMTSLCLDPHMVSGSSQPARLVRSFHRVILEQAERMPGWIEHDPDIFLWLNVGQDRACLQSPAHCLVQVADSDVQMLGCVLHGISGRPHGPLELFLVLEIQAWADLAGR